MGLLINDKQDTIENLTAIIKKLEKRLNTYKRNAEKFIAQDELNLQEIEKIKRDKNSENRKTVHQFMQVDPK